MAKSAHITSTEAVTALRSALLQFAEDASHGVTSLSMEARRAIDWVEQDRTFYWPREMRKASDRLAEARLELQRCELTISGEDRRACYQEKKLLEKAKRRLELTEQRMAAVKRWKFEIRKAVEDFDVQLAKLLRYLENDVPVAGAELQRMAAALDAYTQTFRQPADDRSASSRTSESAEIPAPEGNQ
ncbi:hypothetical protein ETAA8_61060 [Anatilimnocola aggregata]|uniref:Uncharacterized protein n=1 Tax=Anatilimnocola aggregata TaxID=2528021 RepID=A0A517YL60_9BACT|nr:hypothetical protein [Anatilimnocola aggregata]QDU30953.1 hypothetical protein ETAA8_61060 [Anatilimnocola aggregata]